MRRINILILGGTGFIGYHLSLKCKKLGWKVISVSRNKPFYKRKIKNIKYLTGDLSSKKIFQDLNKEKFNYVVNLSGYIEHKNKKKIYKNHYTNVKKIINFFKRKKINSFVQIGSSAEYGLVSSPQSENALCKPKSFYGKSKLEATNFLMKAYKKYNFPVTILRFYQVFGPNQKVDRFIPMLIHSCFKNDELAMSHGKQKRDFLYVDDAIEAIIQCLNNKKCIGQILNVGSGRSIKLLEIIKYVQKKIGSGRFLLGKIKLRDDEPMNVYPSLKKTRKVLKWNNLVSFTNGINNTIKEYKKEFKILNYKKINSL